VDTPNTPADRSALEQLSKEELVDLVLRMAQQNDQLVKRVDELEKRLGKGDPPAFVKANRPDRQKKERKKRNLHFCRKREKPTKTAVHVPADCPDCGRKLKDGWLAYRRQVIDIKPTPVEITEHEVYGRYCGVCGKNVVPKLDLSRQVLGAHRVGIELMSLVAYLKEVGRMSVRTIRHFLRAMYKVHLSVGEITKVLHTVAKKGEETYKGLIKQIQSSPYVHADETGWREDGQNGYLWVAATPTLRCFVHRKSRAGEVAEELLGENFNNILITDFYGGYNRFACIKQKCWVHLLRDLDKLRDNFPDDQAVCSWIDTVADVYKRAKDYQKECRGGKSLRCGLFDRQRMGKRFEAELQDLAVPHAGKQSPAPQRILAERIINFLPELFTFVEFPDVPSENNAAERAIRPAVIARKVCGGTRSEKGSATKATLMSLFQTWQARSLDPIAQCKNMLAGPSP
jgi:hypothetical protein